MNMKRLESVESSMDAWIQQEYDKQQAERVLKIGGYHISDLSGFGYDPSDWCVRQAWYRYKGATDTTYNRERAGWFQRGRDFELRMAEIFLPAIGWEIVASGPITDNDKDRTIVHQIERDGEKINLIAHIDILAKHPPDPETYVIEIKSTNFSSHDVFERFCNEENDFPKPGHVLQANAYGCLKNMPYVIIYLSISDFSLRAWSGKPDVGFFGLVGQRAWVLHDKLKEDDSPDGKVNWACDFAQIKKPRAFCESFNPCRIRGNYGPHPAMFGWCYNCKMAIDEFWEPQNRSYLLIDPTSGRLMCPTCKRRVARKMLSGKNRAFIDGLHNKNVIDPYEKPL